MILTGQEIAELFPKLPRDQINASSFDVRLQPLILTERPLPTKTLDMRSPAEEAFHEMPVRDRGLYITPGQFFLGATVETIDLRGHPDISAQFQLKSSVGRMGLEHLMAGWIEPQFHGTITLELKNILQFNSLLLYPNMPVGQIIFHQHKIVGEEFNYESKGRYLNQTAPQRSKGVGK